MCIETAEDLRRLMKIGRIVGLTLQAMQERLRPGMTTKQLDMIGLGVLQRHKAKPAPFLTYGFPGVACISVNDEAAHGIPGTRVIRAGDVVKIDVSAELDGYFADAAITVPVLPVSSAYQRLCECAKAAFEAAAAVARAGTPINQLGLAAEKTTRHWGYHIIRDLPGHGIGRALHEAPNVPTFYRRQASKRLVEGLVITIEPHIAIGSGRIVTDPDGWTLRTQDGSMAAAFEHTVVITNDRPILVTAV
ncbi:MAG TPA: type I methionyl aminopeptidase [Herpetosiphonaceae bacterium]|nr:type I methionyl aminopeptidase [Herpetosiphonaceae bacterium]